MFSSGSTSKQPSKYQNALGVQSYRASSAESARPVPYLAGKQRLGLIYISDVFDTVTSAVSGGGKGSSRSGYDYYASFAALACHGPVDALHAIYLNGEPVYAEAAKIVIARLVSSNGTATAQTKNAHTLSTNDEIVIIGAQQAEYNGTKKVTVTDSTHFTFPITGTPTSPATTGSNAEIFARVLLPPIFRDGTNPDYVDITIPDYGVMRLYWGTETQTADEYLQKSGTAHPAYGGLCYAVFNRLYLGFNQTNVQNVELVLARYPVSTWLDQQNINDDTSLASFCADLLQHPRAGLKIPDARFDSASWVDAAGTLEDEGMGISPLITRDQETQQALIAALEYGDAFLSFTPDGKIGLKLIRPPVGAVTEIVDSDLLEKPQFSIEDWSAVYNETRVKFNNRLIDYNTDAIGRPDAGARSITNEPKAQTLDRPWVTDLTVAEALQRAYGRAAAVPAVTGRLKLRMQTALFAALAPGEPFTLNYSRRSLPNLILRVESRSVPDPAKPQFDITFRADRSYLYTV